MSYSYEPHPVLPLRDFVVFPGMIVPLFVGRKKSIRALEELVGKDKCLVLVAQKDPLCDAPTIDDIYGHGVLANVLQLLRLPDGTVKVLVEGVLAISLERLADSDDYIEAWPVPVDLEPGDDLETSALMGSIKKGFERYARNKKNLQEMTVAEANEATDPMKLAYMVAGHMDISIEKKQAIFAFTEVVRCLEHLLALIQSEESMLRVEKKIKSRVKSQMERTQKEIYLNEQMKAIQKELGDGEELSEIDKLKRKIDQTEFSDEARERANSELKKLKSMGPMSSEATVVRGYLDWLLAIPWGKKKEVNKDVFKAQEILDDDHYGLQKVKDRIVEYIAVQSRMDKLKGPILCFVGPPGVGKTSLGKSVASATGREFIRISLGGVRDEAEIRGHRRTYIGSMPGKIIQSLRRAESTNPLILLDEIDKLGNSIRGDPASAMLEVLDPEQNSTFMDHYLDLEYDLSDVMFITTANFLLNISDPLLDRMEVISLPGYTEDEKLEIAKRHLIPKQLEAHGVKKKEFKLKNDAISAIIRTYTREAGVRNLEREIAKLSRKAVTRLVMGKGKRITIANKSLEDMLGPPRFRFGMAEEEDKVGIVTGLAWTSVGGDILIIEALKLGGRGRIKATGKLGEVMKESIDAASSYVRSIGPRIGVKSEVFQKTDIHVHVPQAATPKDGPSAGIAMVTSIVSVLTGIAVRKDIAMTGEMTLRGNILPVGGLRAKLLAAIRGGITKVLIPEENVKDLKEISDEIKSRIEIIPVSHIEEVLSLSLVESPNPIEDESKPEEAEILPSPAAQPTVPPTAAQH